MAPLGLADTAAVRLANPLSDEQNLLRISLLPGLLTTARRNLSRGSDGVALFELGLVFLPGELADVVRPGVSGPPDAEALADLAALLPISRGTPRWCVRASWSARAGGAGQSRGLVRRGDGDADGGAGRRCATGGAGGASEVTGWHPGRCAGWWSTARVVGHAGELHPGWSRR